MYKKETRTEAGRCHTFDIFLFVYPVSGCVYEGENQTC